MKRANVIIMWVLMCGCHGSVGLPMGSCRFGAGVGGLVQMHRRFWISRYELLQCAGSSSMTCNNMRAALCLAVTAILSSVSALSAWSV